MRRGFRACNVSQSRPALVRAEGRTLETKTSAVFTNRRTASAPAGFFKSRQIERLLRLKFKNFPGMPGLRPPLARFRSKSPEGGSTLITSAPWSASVRVQMGPITTDVRSIMRIPSREPPLTPIHPQRCRGGLAPDCSWLPSPWGQPWLDPRYAPPSRPWSAPVGRNRCRGR